MNNNVIYYYRCKHSIKQNQEKQHLKLLLDAKDSSPVSGYYSNTDDDDDDEGLEVVESIDALEEEGVVLSGEARRMSMKVCILLCMICF